MASELLAQLAEFLTSKDGAQRQLAARHLGDEYERLARSTTKGGHSPAAFANFQAELNDRMLKLLEGSTSAEQLGGLELILDLAHREGDDGHAKLTNFSNSLIQPIASSDMAGDSSAPCRKPRRISNWGHFPYAES